MISKVKIIIVDIKKGGAMVEKSSNQNDFRKVILIKCEMANRLTQLARPFIIRRERMRMRTRMEKVGEVR